MEAKSKRDEVIEVANKLFIYTDHQQWDNLLSEVFTKEVDFDMGSLNGSQPQKVKATDICSAWKIGFEGVDALHHQSGNYLVRFNADEIEAEVYCYATASHYKQAATQGKTREFVGSYNLHMVLTDEGWRLSTFKYNLKFVTGNVEFT